MEDNELYLIFVDEIGNDTDGNYIYEFMFSETPETVWGNYWEIVPAGICGRLLPNEDTITKKYRLVTSQHYCLAQKNTCFSMQDAIDGVVALFWTDLNGLDSYPKEGRLVLHFGDNLETVNEELDKRDLIITEKE